MANKKKKGISPVSIAKFISLLVIICAFIFLLIFCTFFSRTTSSNYDTLAKKPEFTIGGLFNGSYVEQLIEYYSDTVHNRDAFKDTYAEIKDWFGIGAGGEDGGGGLFGCE